METVADLILNETDTVKKAELIYYLKKKKGIFFDKSVIVKTEIAKLFLEDAKLKNVNTNIILTASMLCACKKVKGAQPIDKIKKYAKESAVFLQELGFNKEFCNICQMHNRYENIMPRCIEGDILEISNQMGGMILDRPDRKAYSILDALEIIKLNLKNEKNEVLDIFEEFILRTEKNYGKNEERDLSEKDHGIIGNETTGLKALNKIDNDDIRGALNFIQDWEIRNGLRNSDESNDEKIKL